MADLSNAPKEFLALFKAGKEAAQRGDKPKAHELLRQAIEVDPYHEQAWLWLAAVVETDEDRQVCFENVLELNPQNDVARRQLERIEAKTPIPTLIHDTPQQRRRWVLILAFLIVLILIGAVVIMGLA